MAMTMGVAKTHEGCKRDCGSDMSGRDEVGGRDNSTCGFPRRLVINGAAQLSRLESKTIYVHSRSTF